MVEVTRLAHVGLRSAKPEAMEVYLVEVLGLWVCQRDDDGIVHLTGGGAGSFIELIPSDSSALDHVALELAAGTDVDDVVSSLAAADIDCSSWGRDDPCAAAALGITDPEGNAVQLIVPSGELVEQAEIGPGLRPLRIGHVATRVRDVATVQSFYEELLGFRWSDSIGPDFAFLRCNADHHAVNFLRASGPGDVHHIAFELQDFLHTQRAVDRLAQKQIGLIWGPGRHGPGHNLFTYHLSPDGQIIELFVGMDRMSHEGQGYFDPRPWHTHRPQRPMVWDPDSLPAANSWGLPPPDTFLA